MFYRPSSLELLDEIIKIADRIGCIKAEPAINRICLQGKPRRINPRVTPLNNTYNIGCTWLPQRYGLAEKPIKVFHFHPETSKNWNKFCDNKNKIGKQLVSDRLKKILAKYFTEIIKDNRQLGIRRRQTANVERKRYGKKKNFFIGFGGTGTSFLVRMLRAKRKKCHVRPDVKFLPDFWPCQLKRMQLLNEKGFENFPTPFSAKEFAKRSGFQLDLKKTINDNMLEYVRFVKKSKCYSLLTFSAYWSFFSKNRIKNVAFLVRHPLHNYVSWTKDKRHGSQIEEIGGINSEVSIKFFAKIWNGIVKEYLLCKELKLRPLLLRFEYINEEFKYARIFRMWESDKRNYGIVHQKYEDLLRELTNDTFMRIYNKWNL